MLVGGQTRTEERQRFRTTFVDTLDIVCVFVGEDMHYPESRRVVRGSDILPLSMAHLIEPIGKLLCLLPLIVLVPSIAHMEESA